MLLLLTGARKSEVLKARWEHVDRHRSLLTVLRAKSGRPRHIPLSPLAVRVIVHQHQRHRPGGDGGWVFPGKVVGKPLEDLRGPWKRAKAAAGLLPDTRIHDLRHTLLLPVLTATRGAPGAAWPVMSFRPAAWLLLFLAPSAPF